MGNISLDVYGGKNNFMLFYWYGLVTYYMTEKLARILGVGLAPRIKNSLRPCFKRDRACLNVPYFMTRFLSYVLP